MPCHPCTIRCERRVCCEVCGLTKKPIGRDSMNAGLCDSDCPGYKEEPLPGHLWPGEFAELKADADRAELERRKGT